MDVSSICILWGLNRNFTPSDLKTKFRTLLRENHPDKHSSDPNATSRMQIINSQRDILQQDIVDNPRLHNVPLPQPAARPPPAARPRFYRSGSRVVSKASSAYARNLQSGSWHYSHQFDDEL